MGKEYKRYYLTSYRGTKEIIVQTNQEYEELLASVNKYNKRTKSHFMIGNITRENTKDGIKVVAHLYTKLTKAMDIKDLLKYTSQYSKEDLANQVFNKTGMLEGYIPDINIAYLENKDKGSEEKIHYDRRIKYLPVLYKEDRKYLSKKFIEKCIKYHVYNRNYGILLGFANEVRFNKNCAEELERVYMAIDKCRYQRESLDHLFTCCKDLFEKYICEIKRNDGTATRNNNEASIDFSVRRLFDVGMYFKYCMDLSKKHSPLMYNEGPNRKKKEELKKEEEMKRVKELIKTGKYEYEQMSLF